jgi:hypothetical protein
MSDVLSNISTGHSNSTSKTYNYFIGVGNVEGLNMNMGIRSDIALDSSDRQDKQDRNGIDRRDLYHNNIFGFNNQTPSKKNKGFLSTSPDLEDEKGYFKEQFENNFFSFDKNNDLFSEVDYLDNYGNQFEFKGLHSNNDDVLRIDDFLLNSVHVC